MLCDRAREHAGFPGVERGDSGVAGDILSWLRAGSLAQCTLLYAPYVARTTLVLEATASG